MGSGGDAPKGGKTATTFRCEALCRHKGGGGWCRRGGVVGSEGKAAGRCGGGRRGGRYSAAAAHLQQKQHPQQLDDAEAAGGGVYAREAGCSEARIRRNCRPAGCGPRTARRCAGGAGRATEIGEPLMASQSGIPISLNPPTASRRHPRVSLTPQSPAIKVGRAGPRGRPQPPSPRKSAMPWHGPRRDARTRRAGPSGCARACGCTCA